MCIYLKNLIISFEYINYVLFDISIKLLLALFKPLPVRILNNLSIVFLLFFNE